MTTFWLRLIFDTVLTLVFAMRVWPQVAWRAIRGARKRRIRFEP